MIATAAFAVGILGLFMLDRDHKVRTSKALWIPVAWMSVAILAPKWLRFEAKDALEALEGNPIEARIFTGLLAIGVIVLVGRRRRVSALLRMNGAILLFFCYCAVSTLWAYDPGVAFKRWIKSLGDLVIVMIVLTDPERPSAVKRFVAWQGFLLLPISVLLIRFYQGLGVQYDGPTGKQWITGVTNDKNMLGAICLLFGLGAVWRFLSSLRERQNLGSNRPLLAHGVILAMALWLFRKANCATSLASFILASCLMAATSFPALARRRVVLHLLAAMIVAVASLPLFLDVGAVLSETLGRDGTLTGRTNLWDEALSMAGNPLFGAGFESFWTGPRLEEMWRTHRAHVNEAHNGYLEVFLNLGWVGVALLAAVIVTGYRNAIDRLRWDRETGGLMLAYILVGVMYSISEAGFRRLNPVWISFLLAALVVPKTSGTRDSFAEADDRVYRIVNARREANANRFRAL